MEQFTNTASSSLNGAITSGATSLVVLSAAAFPTTGNFRILVDAEIMLVTTVAGTTLTVSRAQESTSATAHANGVPVTHLLTAASHVQAVIDRAPTYGTYAARPAASFAGRLYTASDGVVPFVDDGATWHPMIYGFVGTEVAPGNSTAAYTAYNVSNMTTTPTGGCLYLQVPTSNGVAQLLQGQEVTRVAGQSCTCCFIPQPFPGTSSGLCVVGIFIRDHSTGHLNGFNVQLTDGSTTTVAGYTNLVVDQYSSATSYTGTSPLNLSSNAHADSVYWFRIRDDGTNFYYEWSVDGINFWTLLTSAISGNFVATPDRFGMYMNAYSRPVAMSVRSFKVA